MPFFAENFLNVRTEDGFAVVVGDDFTVRLGEMIRATSVYDRATMMTRPLPPERTLWFPPGEYRVDAGFEFPPPVTLSFAPGAVIVPVRTTMLGVTREVVTIAGPIEAALTRIFANEIEAPAGVLVGRVAFVAEGNPRVHPEWWGGAQEPGSPDARTDTAAIRAAIRAAVIDREVLTERAPRPPVAITFSRAYHVNETILVESTVPSGSLRSVVFEGLLDREGSRITVSIPLPPLPADILLSVFNMRRVGQVIVRNLTIDAQGSAMQGLSIEVDLLEHPRHHAVVLEGCTFGGAREEQVRVGDNAAMPSEGGSLAVGTRRCSFLLNDIAHTRPDNEHRSTVSGLSVRSAFGADLTVDACLFDGFLFRGIHTVGGVRARVMGCSFSFKHDLAELLPNGAAIVLGRSGMPRSAPPALDAASCVAATPSFLWVDAPPPSDAQKSPEAFDAGISVVLTAITHHVDRTRALGLYWPPAVVWRGGPSLSGTMSEPRGNSSLTLVGCNFEVPAITAQLAGKENLRTEEQQLLRTFRALPRIPRVFINDNLRQVLNVGTFQEDFPPPAIGAFRMNSSETRSLGPGRALPGPLVDQLPLAFVEPGNRFRLLFAWADW